MSSHSIQVAADSNEASVIGTILLAFGTDPFARWIWPDSHAYLTHFPRFIRAYSRNAFLHQSTYCTDNYLGVAMWLPPDVHPDEDAIDALIKATVPADRQKDVLGLINRMASCAPEEPHGYLTFLAVDAMRRGQGLGAALLSDGLRRFDREKKPTFLESTNPVNNSLYERLGFVLIDTCRIGSSPPVTTMVRHPQ
jgi:ribosomal protein S18 acetylase RimI-like enzyme